MPSDRHCKLYSIIIDCPGHERDIQFKHLMARQTPWIRTKTQLCPVCFRLTTNTIDALKKHHRDLCYGSFEANSHGDAGLKADDKSLMDNFERAVELFLRLVDTVCLDEMDRDGSCELTIQQSADVKSTILELFGPTNAPSTLSQSC
jgi:hypothetical protein